MKTIILWKTALTTLRNNKGRSMLTMLGIIIGIGSIIAILAIGAGAQEKMQKELSSMGENAIDITPGFHFGAGKATTGKKKVKPIPLRLSDTKLIKKQTFGLKAISPIFGTEAIISSSTGNVSTKIYGCNEKIPLITQRKIYTGRFLKKADIKGYKRFIILGNELAINLFGKKNPLDHTVEINQKRFKVIGVMERIENFSRWSNPNLEACIPHTTFKRYLLEMSYHLNFIHYIKIAAKTADDIKPLIRQIRKILRRKHKLKLNAQDDFSIFDQQSLSQAAENSSIILKMLLLLVASISLLVGGIGVMNIMLVSVTERTKEIGIRMALGATANLILLQFLIEAIILCLFGGMCGVLVGIIVPSIAAYFTGWNVLITAHSIVASLIVTVGVGLFFGLYPAHKASQLRPVEALQDR